MLSEFLGLPGEGFGFRSIGLRSLGFGFRVAEFRIEEFRSTWFKSGPPARVPESVVHVPVGLATAKPHPFHALGSEM